MSNKEKGKIYITISVIIILLGWFFTYTFGVSLRHAVLLLKAGGALFEACLMVTQTIAVDLVGLLIGIHGLMLLHS